MATTQYDALIKKSAESKGIPPYVLWGLLSQESGFNPTSRGYNKDSQGNVVSVDRGIAQINSAAHPDVSDAEADDPSFAIPWAAGYLAALSRTYGGDVIKYLTAYNAGHWSANLESSLGYARKVLQKAANGPFAVDGHYTPDSSASYSSTSSSGGADVASEDYTGYEGEYIFPKPVTGELQDYWLDEFPADRGEFDPYKLRIGDVVTHIPPEMIHVAVVPNVNTYMALRQKESMKTKNGSEMTQISMNFYFNGEDHINGYMLDAPEGGVYWMDGLRALLAQFKRMPFLPVENEFLNRTCGIYALAFSSVSVDTVEGFPGLLNVSCVFYEFDTTSLIGFPSFMYDGMIMWPLFRWYYQQMLVGPQDDDSSTANYKSGRSSTKLKRVSAPLEQDISFKILNEEVLSANRNTLKNWSSEQLNRSFIPFEFMGDFVVTNFNATFGNLLTPITLDLIGKPTFQYFGGLDTRIRLTIETSNEEVVVQLRNLNETMEHYSRVYRNRFVGGYLRVTNDLINMMGVDFCMIEQLTIATTPGFPGHYTAELSLISFNKTQMDGEKLDGWNGFDTKTGVMPSLESFPGQDPKGFSNFIIQEVRAEAFLDNLELYPDMELPTYDHLNEQIKLVNDYRKKNRWPRLPITSLAKTNPKAVYVDPDFYMIYPDMGQYLSGGGTDVLGVDLDSLLSDRSINLQRLVDVKEDGSRIEHSDNNPGQIEGKVVTSKQKSWAAPSMTRGKWEAIKKKALTGNYLRDAWTYAPADNGKGVNPENYSVGYLRQQPGYDTLKHMMCYDAFKYSKRGTMLRAFPTYVFMIIDEGQWVNTRKIWNNYYAYHVVNSISVVRDRKNPADTAYVSLSNIYGALNYQSRPPYQQSQYIKQYGDSAVGEIMSGMRETFDYIYPSLEAEAQKWATRANLLTAGYLQAGARVHIRLGYGSCASDMPTVFNGVVTETDASDEMTIICQGDGIELINSDIKADGKELNAWWEEGDNGQALIQYYLTKAGNDLIFNATDRIAAALGRNNMYGIEHFGYVRQFRSTDWGDHFWSEFTHMFLTGWSSNLIDPDNPDSMRGNMDPYDVVKNIYSTAGAAATTGVKDTDNGGETINTFLAGKSPWDVFRLMAKVHTDYIVYPTYHNFHSTLFFGQQHWLCKQGWVLPEGAKGDIINDYKDFTKPFSQIHFLNGMEDIVHNSIKAVGADLITHCYALYYEGNGDKTGPTAGPAVWADQRIRPELQKTKLVDSTIVQSYVANWIWQLPFQSVAWLEGKIEYAWDEAYNMGAAAWEWTSDELDKFESWVTGVERHAPTHIKRKNGRWNALTRGAQQSVNFAISTVAESFKDMYQGNLLIMGDSAIKPYDFVYVNDFYTQMNGLCEVQRVVHTMSLETGFMTEIVPDLAVAQIHGDTYIANDPLVSSKTNGIKAGLEIGSLASVRAMRLMMGWATLRAYNNAIRIGKATLELGKKAESLEEFLQGGRRVFSAAKELPTFAKMGDFFKTARTTLRAAITGEQIAVAEGTVAAGPEVWVGLVIEAGIFVVMDIVIDEVLDWLNMDHNCVKIFPLYYKGHPYVAGVSGHKNLIPGQQDEFMYGDSSYTLEGDPTGVLGS